MLGRGTEADLRIDDPGVSRKHAQISMSGDTAVVTDLGSTNGTIVDGQRVGQAALVDGTEIRLGSTTAVFQRQRDGG